MVRRAAQRYQGAAVSKPPVQNWRSSTAHSKTPGRRRLLLVYGICRLFGIPSRSYSSALNEARAEIPVHLPSFFLRKIHTVALVGLSAGLILTRARSPSICSTMYLTSVVTVAFALR